MTIKENGVDLVLIANQADRASDLHKLMVDAGIGGVIRTIAPGNHAIQRARQTGIFRQTPMPDLFFFDYTDPNADQTAVLLEIAFSTAKSRVPVVLLTSPKSQKLLEAGSVDDGKAVMLSPTPIASFVGKMRIDNRVAFFKALHILYEYGPLLVHAPETLLNQDVQATALSA